MKKFAKLPLILALAYFIISIPLSNDTVYADEPLHENNTTTLVATADSQEELIGTDFITITPSPFRSISQNYTNTQILSKNAVREIFHNLNNLDKAVPLLSTFIGFRHPITEAILGLSGFQNPNFRNAITKAYYQGKRVKIVMKSAAAMSLRQIDYYVIN